MKNVSKILCVVLALVMALSAASCSLTKQYAYQKDDIELPIGVYIYNMFKAYNEAMNYAQQSESYDAETGKYDGQKSFLKMEITPDGEDEAVVAEDWIKEQAEKETKHAVAVMTKYNELGCTMDEAQIEEGLKSFKSSWDKSDDDDQMSNAFLQYFGGTKKTLESYGIGYESIYDVIQIIPMMEQEAFNAEYGTDGPSAVSDKEIEDYLKENYTSYKYISVNLYTTETADAADDASSETTTTNVPFSDDQIAEYQAEFEGYASTLADGGSFEDAAASYMEKHSLEEDPTQSNVTKIEDDTTDEIQKTIKEMKDGQAMTIEIGETEDAKQMYLLYREPIENQYKSYTDPEGENRASILKDMKQDEFNDSLDEIAEDIKLSSACKSYKPSLFEDKKKKSNS